jgi:hypothetical protein
VLPVFAGGVVVVVVPTGTCVTVPELAARIAVFNGSNQQFASFTFPLSFGCTPSPVSVAVLKPVKQSTTVIGLALVLFDAAQAGIALFKATTPAAQMVQVLGFMGVICATRMRMVLLDARIWSISVEKAFRIVPVAMLLQTSFVASSIITISGFETASHPGSWLLDTIPVARYPPWPSFSPS